MYIISNLFMFMLGNPKARIVFLGRNQLRRNHGGHFIEILFYEIFTHKGDTETKNMLSLVS